MVKGDRIDDHEATEIILVRIIVAMPTNHIEGGVVLTKPYMSMQPALLLIPA